MQRTITRSWFQVDGLRVLTAFVALIFVQSLLIANLMCPSQKVSWFWNLKVMSPDIACTLLVGLLSLSWAQEQYAATVRPFLTYSCKMNTASEAGLPHAGSGRRYWTVAIENAGPGLAILQGAGYHVRFSGSDPDSTKDYKEFSQAIDSFKEKKWIPGIDFSLSRFVSGGILASQSRAIVFEVPEEKIHSISTVEIQVKFEGILGDTYIKDVFCIPKTGIEQHIGPLIYHLNS